MSQTLSQLPVDLLHHIFQFVQATPKQVAALELTCKLFAKQVIHLWKICATIYFNSPNGTSKDACRSKFVKKKLSNVNVAFYGAQGVGKATIVRYLTCGKFDPRIDPTIDEYEQTRVTVNTITSLVSLQKVPTAMMEMGVSASFQGAVLVCSMDNMESVQWICKFLAEHDTIKVPLIVMMNKQDKAAQKVVTFEQVKQMIHDKCKSNSIEVFATSAKQESQSIRLAMQHLVTMMHDLVKSKYEPKTNKTSTCTMQ